MDTLQWGHGSRGILKWCMHRLMLNLAYQIPLQLCKICAGSSVVGNFYMQQMMSQDGRDLICIVAMWFLHVSHLFSSTLFLSTDQKWRKHLIHKHVNRTLRMFHLEIDKKVLNSQMWQRWLSNWIKNNFKICNHYAFLWEFLMWWCWREKCVD